jgi:hypothetical protein
MVHHSKFSFRIWTKRCVKVSVSSGSVRLQDWWPGFNLALHLASGAAFWVNRLAHVGWLMDASRQGFGLRIFAGICLSCLHKVLVAQDSSCIQ